MSYEGYTQYLCKNGHYWEDEASPMDQWTEEESSCHVCKTSAVWANGVDETNGDGVGYIPMDQLVIKAEESKVCDMGHSHIIAEAIYRVPSEEETKALRTYRLNDAEGTLMTCVGDKKMGVSWPIEGHT